MTFPRDQYCHRADTPVRAVRPRNRRALDGRVYRGSSGSRSRPTVEKSRVSRVHARKSGMCLDLRASTLPYMLYLVLYTVFLRESKSFRGSVPRVREEMKYLSSQRESEKFRGSQREINLVSFGESQEGVGCDVDTEDASVARAPGACPFQNTTWRDHRCRFPFRLRLQHGFRGRTMRNAYLP